MDSDRPPHSRAAATTELFICFTSRLSSSSSSMKLTKSLLSPARAARDGPASLSSSLSRRNGSLKAGQASPFFPTRKRGCAFENPEPSSPKVTCIGQVRVKTKKKVKQSRSRRSGEVSFRKIEGGDGGGIEDKRYSNASAHYQPPQEHRNQRWVHLPVSICEALRTFGAEFSCLFPCKTSCFSSERVGKDGEKHDGCGAVFTRWLVSVNDGEGGKRREIELVVGGGDEEEEEAAASSRRHVFEDIEVKDDRIEVKGQDGHLEEAARVSICIPPKNALLLMRCRSDPMKMADLATRFSWDAPNAVVSQDIEEEIEENAAVSQDIEENAVISQDEPEEEQCEEVEHEVTDQDNPISGEEITDEPQQDLCCTEEIQQLQLPICVEEEIQEEQLPAEEMAADELHEILEYEEEVESNMSSFEALLAEENGAEPYDDSQIQDKEEEEVEVEAEESPICHLSPSTESESPICHLSPSTESEEDEDAEQTADETVLKETIPNNDLESEERETEAETGRETEAQEPASKREKVLPECLVLMMCEPKLSMEVSKETWVCSRDFIRWLPHNEQLKRRLSIDSKPKTAEPPRSSVIEHKLVNAVAYEPFVLTRCKSEPMRTAAAKLAPESCFWKNAIRKLEPHRRGVGAAGVGF